MAFERTLNFDFEGVWQERMVPNYSTPSLYLERGEGCHVWDVKGRRYLDLLAGIAVLSLGHGHPALVKAVQEQAGRLMHTSNLYGNLPALRLARRLSDATGLPKALFVTSGAEANEAAIKLARKRGAQRGWPRGDILCFDRGFHGRTLGALAATGQPRYWKGFEPLPPGFVHVPYDDLAAAEQAIDAQTVAVMFEPVQGEGGVHPASRAFAQGLRKLCDAHGLLLIADEVQTGVGRTGTFLACEQLGVQPDVVTLGKGLGGGLPLAAMLATGEAAQALQPGDHGCTFGGNPVTAAAGLAVMDALAKDDLRGHVNRVAPALRKALADAGGKHVTEVRGMGLLLGVELAEPVAPRVRAIAQEEGLLVSSIGDRVLRIAPPLVLTQEQALEGAALLGIAISKAAKEQGKDANAAKPQGGSIATAPPA